MPNNKSTNLPVYNTDKIIANNEIIYNMSHQKPEHTPECIITQIIDTMYLSLSVTSYREDNKELI